MFNVYVAVVRGILAGETSQGSGRAGGSREQNIPVKASHLTVRLSSWNCGSQSDGFERNLAQIFIRVRGQRS